jgi:electron transfer flavoprotein beta subunit
MNVLACIKRVPDVGAKITLTPDAQEIDTHLLGFTISPHEECAVEEAVRIVEQRGGTASVLTLGPSEAAEQLRDAAAIGAARLVLLETDGREWGPMATARAIVEAVQRHESENGTYDLILFGNEAADTGDYQVGIRVAHALGRPCATGIKNLEIEEATVRARREFRGGDELFELDLPAVVSVKEGINLPRYPSLPGRMRAKKAAIEQTAPEWREDPAAKQALRVPVVERQRAEILGTGVEAVPALVGLLEQLGVLS